MISEPLVGSCHVSNIALALVDIESHTYSRRDVYRADIAVIFGTAVRAARGGLLADYAHGLVVYLILRLVRVRFGSIKCPPEYGEGDKQV